MLPFILDNSTLGNMFANGADTGIALLNSIRAGTDTFIVPDQIALEANSAFYSS